MSDWKDSAVAFQVNEGFESRARLLRTNRLAAVFEIASPESVIRISEVFKAFRILVRERAIYSGRAVVRNLLNTGSSSICEVTLQEGDWMDVALNADELRNGSLGRQFQEFLGEWQKLYRVESDYKVIVADMHSFLSDLRLWLEQVQMSVRESSSSDAAKLESDVALNLADSVLPCIDVLFEKFERIASRLDEEQSPAHRNYMRRQLHPLVLCAPFAYRTFVKPLGYAGDYEMVNMISRNRPEGESLYAKIVNTWFVRQPPAEAHRNRLKYLSEKLLHESLRTQREGRSARVCNVACGPAHEVQDFVGREGIADRTHFTMIDFNEETLSYLKSHMDEITQRTGRRTGVDYVKKSVHRLLKESERGTYDEWRGRFDYVYCAGLFDYLSDNVCHALLEIMHDWVAPGGLLLATNVEPRNPLRQGMEHLLDWNLIYRTAAQMLSIRPNAATLDDCVALSDSTGVNVFLEVRKPAHG